MNMDIRFANNKSFSSIELLQDSILRISTSNISQRKSKKQLIVEHKNLEYFSVKNEDVIIRQDESALNLLQIENRISIANLQVDHVHTGRFLLCRVMTSCVKINALLTLVEDPEGNTERLALYNLLQPATKQNPLNILSINQLLPLVTHLVIKNPSYKVAGDGNTIILSDNPKDVIVLNHNNELFNDLKWSTEIFSLCYKLLEDKMNKSADDYRRCGNNYFASGDYTAAINEYSGGIELEPQNVTLRANRAEVYLRLYRFHNAFADVELALKHEPSHIKATYRKGKALCGLKRYQEAVITLQDLHQRIKVNTNSDIAQNIEKLLKHSKMLALENRSGQYDYASIIDEFRKMAKIREDGGWVNKEGPRLDHADFLIDDIEIRPVKGKGRGWIAKCDIPEKTLLMVSKAFKVVYNNEVPPSEAVLDIPDISECSKELMIRIGQSLLQEKYYCREVYQLCASSFLGKREEDRMYLTNMQRIASIVRHNAYTLQYEAEIEMLNCDLPGIGLWILPSYFNHSCVDTNVDRFFIGDLLFLRSSQPILKGEELIIGYTCASFSYERRSRYLESVEINCQCRLCKLDRSEIQKTKLRRAQLLDNYKKLIIKPINPSLIKELEKIIGELRSLRKEHPELEFHSLKLRQKLASYYKNSNPNRSLSILKEIYDFWEAVPPDQPITSIIFDISLVYIKLKQKKEARKWFDIALKELVEPIRGKFKDDETNWRKEALDLAEKLSPSTFLAYKKIGLI